MEWTNAEGIREVAPASTIQPLHRRIVRMLDKHFKHIRAPARYRASQRKQSSLRNGIIRTAKATPAHARGVIAVFRPLETTPLARNLFDTMNEAKEHDALECRQQAEPRSSSVGREQAGLQVRTILVRAVRITTFRVGPAFDWMRLSAVLQHLHAFVNLAKA